MLCFLWADRSPENGALLNYTQVFFKWDQVPSANIYILNISNNANGEVTSFNSSENSIIIDEFIEWGSGYNWNICSYSIDGIEQYCSDNYL